MNVCAFALRYFAWVFAAGFVLGSLRVLWLVPMIGALRSELLEQPFMVLISLWVARRQLRRVSGTPDPWRCLLAGALALALLLGLEFTLVLALRGDTLTDYLGARRNVAGAAYLLALILFALAPALLALRAQRGAR